METFFVQQRSLRLKLYQLDPEWAHLCSEDSLKMRWSALATTLEEVVELLVVADSSFAVEVRIESVHGSACILIHIRVP